MTIGFNAIPLDLRVPGNYVEIDASRARKGLPRKTPRVLILGQAATRPNAPTRIFSPAEGVATYGATSVLGGMIAAFMAANSSADVYALALGDDAAGVAATGTITLTGPAAAAGVLSVTIGGVDVSVAVAAGDSATVLAARLVAAINSGASGQPVTAANAAGVITTTFAHKGLTGNSLNMRINPDPAFALPAGVTVAFAAMSGGAVDPDLSVALANVGDMAFDAIVTCLTSTGAIAALTTEMASRWGPTRMLDGLVFAGLSASLGTAATFGAAQNSPYLTVLPVQSALTAPWIVAAAYAGVVAHYGAIDPARPFQTLPLPGVRAPAETNRFTRLEREQLLRDGMSTWIVDAGGVVTLERPITTYQVDAAGNADPSYLDVNVPLTLSYLRWSLNVRIRAKYPRHKLGSDGGIYGIGQPIVTPRVLRVELVALALEWQEAGLVENIDQFKAGLVVERDATDQDRANALIPPDLINGFRVFAASIQFRS